MTASVVARCPDSGDLGVAVLTHGIAVGGRVPWVFGGIGAVATQGVTAEIYGELGLQMLSAGKAPAEILSELTTQDLRAAIRQVAIVSAHGVVASHTGASCIEFAGSTLRDGAVFQANLMRAEGVSEAMAEAWDASGHLAFPIRLAQCLKAAQLLGGDLRGNQTTALKIAESPRSDTSERFNGVYVDLRVDHHHDPLAELDRLLEVRLAIREEEIAQQYDALGDRTLAKLHFDRAQEILPDSPGIAFWSGVADANAGELDRARSAFALAFRVDGWRELLYRLPASGILAVEPSIVDPTEG